MNRQMRRASLANGRRLQNKPWDKFQVITEEAQRRHLLLNPASDYKPDVVYRNNKFIVQCFLNKKILGKAPSEIKE